MPVTEVTRPPSGFQTLFRRVFPKDHSFFAKLEQLSLIAQRAVTELGRLGAQDASPDEVAQAVLAVEHEADAVFHEVEAALARTFVTPIDREDIHQLAFEIEEIVDTVNVAARTCSLLRIKELTPAMKALLATLGQCTDVLAEAFPLLRRNDYAGIMVAARKIRGFEKEADTVFRQTLSALFQDPSTNAKELLKEKELIEHFEEAVDRCDRLANTLSSLAVKHG
ncbi:MAG: DUF47 family protein [Polyangiaceae bacterium]|nr:DUF47 family protein [Polyangiaceae bacterium]